MKPHEVWQELLSPDTPEGPRGATTYAAALPDGRRVVLPIRVLPGGTDRAVASLIVNQASFAVLDALAETLARAAGPIADIVVGVPTLGLPLAEGVARRLGHSRLVPLSTSRKFWYDEGLSQPVRSITTPDQSKRIYLDPRMLPLLAGRRVLLVDDVLSTGSSITAVLRLLRQAGVVPAAIAAAMLQGTRWQAAVQEEAPGIPVLGAIRTPILIRDSEGWRPE